MALTADETHMIDVEVGEWLLAMPMTGGIRNTLLAHGRAGHAACIADIIAEIGVVMDAFYGQAAPTISP